MFKKVGDVTKPVIGDNNDTSFAKLGSPAFGMCDECKKLEELYPINKDGKLRRLCKSCLKNKENFHV
jgi:hypothetical protein